MINKIVNHLDYASHQDYSFDGSYSRSVIDELLSECRINKSDIIEFMSKFEAYNDEEFRIKFDVTYKVRLNATAIKNKMSDLNMYVDSKILSHLILLYDENTSSVTPVIKVIFEYYGYKVSEGLKLTRAISKVVDDKIKDGTSFITDINQLFAQLSDMLNTTEITETWYLSVSPFDFFRMSHGNSWASCQHIGGSYASGITSYMMDKVTAILYREASDKNHLITRRLIIFDDKKVYCGRIYGSNKNVDPVTEVIMNQIATLIESETPCYSSNTNLSYHTHSSSSHYPDYGYGHGDSYFFSKEVVFYDRNNEIGYYPTCINCGGHDAPSDREGSNLNCKSCTHDGHYCNKCGTFVDDDDVYYDDDREEYYCFNCASTCNHCGNVHDNRDMIETEDGIMCDSCIGNHYISCDDCGNYIHVNNIIVYEDDETGYNECYCESCFNSR